MARCFVMGIGNTLRRDEGIGVRILEELRPEEMTGKKEVVLLDGGTSPYAALCDINGQDDLIIIDAMCDRSRQTGEISIIDRSDITNRRVIDAHQNDISQTLRCLDMEKRLPRTTILGIEVKDISWGEGLSDELKKMIPSIREKIHYEIRRRNCT